MNAKNVVGALALVSMLALPAFAKGHFNRGNDDGVTVETKAASTDTRTWWCVDLNTLWHTDLPVLINITFAHPPDPSPIANPCSNSFPVVVPKDSQFIAVGAAGWWTNRVYPAPLLAILKENGYNFVDASPAEDLMKKMVEVRVEIRPLRDPGTVVATFRYDPRKNFRLIRVGEMLPYDFLTGGAISYPDLGVDLSADEVQRLPFRGFPAPVGPVPPGEYRARVYWVLSDLHCDGLDIDPAGNFLYPGDNLISNIRFVAQ